jgi:hypothetical protein
MDGVIVDLVGAAASIFGDNAQAMIGSPTCHPWRDLGQAFWAGCPWTDDGREILNYAEIAVGQENVIICTRPPICPQAAAGKMEWVMRNMPEHYADTMMIVRHKWRIQGGILIDDSEINTDNYLGPSILVPRPWNRHSGMNTIEYVREQLNALVA